MTDDDTFDISRRKVLGAAATVGAAGAVGGAGTSALLWDEETFGDAADPNVLQAGNLDLKVDWDVRYFNDITDPAADDHGDLGTIDATSADEAGAVDGQVDNPGPLVNLTDVKPGDVIEKTLSLHVYDNPGFVSMGGAITADEDNDVVEPEDEVDGEVNDSDGDPFSTSSLLGLGLVGGASLPSLRSRLGRGDGVRGGNDGSTRLGSTARKAAFAAGAGVAGATAMSGTAAAGHNDTSINIDNGTLEVNVGELHSGGGGVSGTGDWFFEGTDTLYREYYAFRDGDGAVSNADDDGTVTNGFPTSTGTPGTDYTGTIEIDVESTSGGTTTLTVDRTVNLDPTDPILRVSYDVENTGSEALDSLKLYQYFDYDIGSPGGEVGRYTFDSDSGREYIWQEDQDIGLFGGFTASTPSSSHDLDNWWATNSKVKNGDSFNDDDQFPDSGDGDVGLAFEWTLGALAPGESTTLQTSAVYADDLEEFEEDIGEESPGGDEESDEGDGELDDLLECVVWYDGNDASGDDPGDNFPAEITDYSPEEREQFLADLRAGEVTFDDTADEFIFQGSLRELFETLEGDGGVLLDPAGESPEEFSGTQCFRPSTTHYVGMLSWLERDIPGYNDNIVQTDRVEYFFGFDAIQCRHNVDEDGMPIDGTIGEADAESGHSGDGDDDDSDDGPESVTTTFDTDDDGWVIVGDAQEGSNEPDYHDTGGNPGGHICADDDVAGGTWYFSAPSQYLGNKSGYYGGSLSFDLTQSATDSQFDNDDIVLSDGSSTIVYDFGGESEHPGTDWTSYDVPLSATDSGWTHENGDPVSQSEFQTVLGGLSKLRIRGEYRTGSDTGCLDNVAFSPP